MINKTITAALSAAVLATAIPQQAKAAAVGIEIGDATVVMTCSPTFYGASRAEVSISQPSTSGAVVEWAVISFSLNERPAREETRSFDPDSDERMSVDTTFLRSGDRVTATGAFIGSNGDSVGLRYQLPNDFSVGCH